MLREQSSSNLRRTAIAVVAAVVAGAGLSSCGTGGQAATGTPATGTVRSSSGASPTPASSNHTGVIEAGHTPVAPSKVCPEVTFQDGTAWTGGGGPPQNGSLCGWSGTVGAGTRIDVNADIMSPALFAQDQRRLGSKASLLDPQSIEDTHAFERKLPVGRLSVEIDPAGYTFASRWDTNGDGQYVFRYIDVGADGSYLNCNVSDNIVNEGSNFTDENLARAFCDRVLQLFATR